MRSIFDGARAGVLAGFILTLWAFLSVTSGGGTATGMKFVATAFGLLTVPQILYGVGLGAVVAIWAVTLKRAGYVPLGEGLKGEKDRRGAAVLLTVPVLVGVVGAGVMGLHLGVTSSFNRVGFQAQGLALGAAGLALGAVLVAPLVLGLCEKVLGWLPLPEGWSRTVGVLGLFGVGGVVGLVGAAMYARGLHVWSDTEIAMTIAFVLVVPLLMGAMYRWSVERVAWKYGVPTAGLVVAVVCFGLAGEWAAESAEMRAATYRDAPVVSTLARQVIPLEREAAEGIFAFADCDEDDEDCVLDEPEIPVTSADHPARRAVALAVAAGDRAQVDEFESLPEPPKNLVLIMVDTLRQDHLGFAGYHRETSPNMDAIAAEATVFMDAYATSPHTPRSLPPLFFSRYASRIAWYGAQYNFPRVRPENLSMFEVLEERGGRNIGMTSHFYFDERRNVHQGFAVWDNHDAKSLEDSHTDIAAPRIWGKVEPVIAELGEQRRELGEEAPPFSLFVHFFDPHARWNYHEEFGFERGSTTRERHIAAYDSEIAFADRHVGKIVEKLKEEGLYDDTIFVITSDHGEAFNEHGFYFHGQTLYNTVMNVPMIIRVPGWFPRQVEGPVSIIDIAPTVLDLMGVTIPQEFEGVNLSQVMLGRRPVPERPVFMELLPYTAFPEHHRAVVYGDQKLIVNFTLDVEEFYDLSEDRMEQNDLIRERPEDAARLREMLDEFMGR